MIIHSTTSFLLSKTLKLLGAPQQSKLYWCKDANEWCLKNKIEEKEYYSAYSISELSELLPWQINIKNKVYSLVIYKQNKYWEVWYKSKYISSEGWESSYLVEAMGYMLKYLLQNKFILNFDDYKPTYEILDQVGLQIDGEIDF